MAATIYYFSATGNSLLIARQLAKGLENCCIQSMTNKPSLKPIGGEGHIIGFVFPVYYISLPKLVKTFIEKINIQKGTYCFAFLTYGGVEVGTLGLLDQILKEKGLHLSYGTGTRMPGNYIIKYSAYNSKTQHKQIKIALETVDRVVGEIANLQLKKVKRTGIGISKLISHLLLYKNFSQWDKKFHVTSKCISCGQCAKICPVHNIKMTENHPQWLHHCERCVACIQWCPKQAIEYGSKTVGRKRYHNPFIKVSDIINSSKNTQNKRGNL